MKKARERGEKKPEVEEKRERRLFNDGIDLDYNAQCWSMLASFGDLTSILELGKALNVNEAKVDFVLTDDEEHNCYSLDISVFKHMDTSLMDADVHPHYVRVVLKGKVWCLVHYTVFMFIFYHNSK